MKYDIFISYSRKDIEVATKICAVLNEYKKFYDFKYFFDISEIGSSAAYLKKIAAAIDSSRAVLFVASKDSCKSEFCSKELLFADKRGVRIHQYRIDNSDVPLDLDILLGTHQYREMSTTPIECEVQEVLSDVLGYDVLPLAELKSSNQVVDSCDAEKVDIDDVATASAADDTTSDKLSKGESKNDDGVIGRLLAAFRGLFAFCFKAIKTIAVVLGVVFVFICFDVICDDEADDTDVVDDVPEMATESVVTEECVEEVALVGNPQDAHHIVISKESLTLNLYDSQGGLIYSFPVAVGKNYGNKKEKGDFKTPEGEFTIKQIQDASTWGHDFKDGKGRIEGAYGNWFIRLDTPPHTGIGIHGTHDPNSIGTRATEGCIHLNNDDLNKLHPLVKVGMKVTIESSILDMEEDGKSDPSGVNQEIISYYDEDDFFEDFKKNEQKPLGETPKDEVPAVYHTIVSGDMFGKLAEQYGTTTKKIEELNPDLNPNNLRLGQKIRVK